MASDAGLSMSASSFGYVGGSSGGGLADDGGGGMRGGGGRRGCGTLNERSSSPVTMCICFAKTAPVAATSPTLTSAAATLSWRSVSAWRPREAWHTSTRAPSVPVVHAAKSLGDFCGASAFSARCSTRAVISVSGRFSSIPTISSIRLFIAFEQFRDISLPWQTLPMA
eukprot:733202-Prymnesium_polylepis.2